jgi:lipopolysaccharide export system permease protein
MKIARKYLLAEMSGPFLLGLASFSLVVLLHRFSRLSDLVIARGVPPRLVGRLLVALFPPFLEITIPAALLLAVLLALGRLAADSETTAMAAAGMGIRGVAVPVLLAGGIAFSAALLVAWEGIPWGHRETQRVLSRIVSERAGAGATEHLFREITPDVLVYPDRVSADGQRMSGVFLSFRPAGGEDPLFVFAREGRFAPADESGVVSLELEDGEIHHEDRARLLYRMASFGRMDFRVPLGVPALLGGDNPRGMTLPQLAGKMEGAAGASFRYHFHRRLSLAVTCLSFGLLAIPFGMAQRARGRSSAFGITVALIVVYYLFLAAAGAVERYSPALTVVLLWAPNILGFASGGYLLWRLDQRLAALPGPLQALMVRR